MRKNLKFEIMGYIEKNKDELFSSVQDVVRIPSVFGNEGPAQKFMESKYKKIGLDVVLYQAEHEKICGHPAFVESGLSYNNRPNIIGILKGDPLAKSVTLHGHIDVVSPEPISSWIYNPWGGEIVEGRLYGRGALDMKGGLMANYFALKTIINLGMSTVEEEVGGGPGTLACLIEGYRTDGFVGTEPHALKVTVAHGGILYFKIKLIGKTSHAGMAHLGVNAIGKMYPIYQALIELDTKRGREIKFDLFAKGSGRATHLNIGKMVAGDWASTVAGFAELDCRISFVPGETEAEIKELIHKTVKEVADRDPWLAEHQPTVEWYGWHTDPWLQDPESPYVRSFLESGTQVLGYPMEIVGRASGNDARFTQFFDKMSGICFGPLGENIHGLDEYVTLDSLVKTAQILALHVVDWCGLE